jgi:hypothetical protein
MPSLSQTCCITALRRGDSPMTQSACASRLVECDRQGHIPVANEFNEQRTGLAVHS